MAALTAELNASPAKCLTFSLQEYCRIVLEEPLTCVHATTASKTGLPTPNLTLLLILDCTKHGCFE